MILPNILPLTDVLLSLRARPSFPEQVMFQLLNTVIDHHRPTVLMMTLMIHIPVIQEDISTTTSHIALILVRNFPEVTMTWAVMNLFWELTVWECHIFITTMTSDRRRRMAAGHGAGFEMRRHISGGHADDNDEFEMRHHRRGGRGDDDDFHMGHSMFRMPGGPGGGSGADLAMMMGRGMMGGPMMGGGGSMMGRRGLGLGGFGFGFDGMDAHERQSISLTKPTPENELLPFYAVNFD
jgi:hypothetical protein